MPSGASAGHQLADVAGQVSPAGFFFGAFWGNLLLDRVLLRGSLLGGLLLRGSLLGGRVLLRLRLGRLAAPRRLFRLRGLLGLRRLLRLACLRLFGGIGFLRLAGLALGAGAAAGPHVPEPPDSNNTSGAALHDHFDGLGRRHPPIATSVETSDCSASPSGNAAAAWRPSDKRPTAFVATRRVPRWLRERRFGFSGFSISGFSASAEDASVAAASPSSSEATSAGLFCLSDLRGLRGLLRGFPHARASPPPSRCVHRLRRAPR